MEEIEFNLEGGVGWYLGNKGWYYYDLKTLSGPFEAPDPLYINDV
jgi:hypothetical protein